LTQGYFSAINNANVDQKGGSMQSVDRAIEDYLDAVKAFHGEDFRAQTSVETRGGVQVVLKSPDHERPMLIDLGMLELMTKHLRHEMTQAA